MQLPILSFLNYEAFVSLHLGPFAISPHGVGTAVGFIVGAVVLLARTRQVGIKDEDTYAMLLRGGIGALIGARLFYVLRHLSDYADNPLEALMPWKGGLTLLGGVTGAILLALPYIRRHKLGFWRIMDFMVLGLAVGIFIGRIGDLLVADHLGTPTDFFLGYRCPGAATPSLTASPCAAGTGGAVHQTAFYDMVQLTILIPVLYLVSRKVRYDGFVALFFVAWYGIARVLEDFVREDVRTLGLMGSQWAALAASVIALTILLLLRRSPGELHLRRASSGGDDSVAPPDG